MTKGPGEVELLEARASGFEPGLQFLGARFVFSLGLFRFLRYTANRDDWNFHRSRFLATRRHSLRFRCLDRILRFLLEVLGLLIVRIRLDRRSEMVTQRALKIAD